MKEGVVSLDEEQQPLRRDALEHAIEQQRPQPLLQPPAQSASDAGPDDESHD